jgi:hypothetical protein
VAQENGNEISIQRRVDNFVRAVANGATFGLADVIAGTLNAKLLNTTSCSSAALCIDEEIRRSNKAIWETPAENTVGLLLGARGLVRGKATQMVQRGDTPAAAIEHVFAIQLGSFLSNIGLKNYIENKEIKFAPEVPDSEITAPSFENLSKELLGLRKR